MATASLQKGLAADRCTIDEHLHHLLAGEPNRANGLVYDAMTYAVLGPAQRIRPILTLRVARLFGAPLEITMRAAAAVELLHSASLIVDDLPCMDDSPLRRNQPAVHVRFGEATALLAAFGLVALAARTLIECRCSGDYRQKLIEFQIALLKSLDCAGLIAGQALDLQLTRSRSFNGPCNVSELKTVPLFILAVSAGSLFADLDSNEKALLSCFGREFGLAFQMTDDLLDGEPTDVFTLQDKFTTLRAAISPFGPACQGLEELVDYLDARAAAAHAN